MVLKGSLAPARKAEGDGMKWSVVRNVYDHEELVLEEVFEFNGTPENFF